MDLYITNPPEKALAQYGFNYFFGFSHFHDKKSLRYYLDLYNRLNPTMTVCLNWNRIPDYLSIWEHDRGRERLICPDSFNYTDKDIIATAMDDIGNRNPTPLNGFDRIVLSNGDYFAVHLNGMGVRIPFYKE
jgi:hypothetical protein